MEQIKALRSVRLGCAVAIACAGLAACRSPEGEGSSATTVLKAALSNPLPNATGDPSLFGFGYAQLAIIDGSNLQVLASPVRVQDAPWTTRWLSPLSSAPPVIVAGDFWHAPDGKAYLLAIKNGTVTVQNPPEIPSAVSWPAIGSAQTLPSPPTGTILDAAAGDFLGRNRDQLVVITSTRIAIYEPPASPGGAWTKSSDLALPVTATSVAAGEFWAGTSDDEEMRYRSDYRRNPDDNSLYDQGIGHGPHGKDQLCLLRSDGKLGFYNWSGGAWAAYRTSATTVSGKIATGDFLRRGRDSIAVVATGTPKTIKLYEAPLADNGTLTLLTTSNISDRVPTTITDVTADRLYGYVDQSIAAFSGNRRGTIPTAGSDLEIAFIERTPKYRRRSDTVNYGWPASGEAVTYTAYLKNNGPTPIPANTVTVKFWLNRTARNADILAPTTPDDSKLVTVAIPPYDPTLPWAQRYVTVTAKTFPWPYSLITDAPGTWKKLNVGTVGERWTIASASGGTDLTARNNRIESALHAWIYHPVFATHANLADRQPTVGGDPASREYLGRKLSDFIDVAWARSSAGDKTGADIRVSMDGYEVDEEWPQDPTAHQAKHDDVWDLFEGPRDSADWFGGNWELGKYCSFEGDEMHETGHLFHELGDLYQYTVEPSLASGVKRGDGKIPQLRSWVWSNQEHANNCHLFSENDVLTHVHVVGMRNAGGNGNETHVGWTQIAPAKVYIKVVDRSGNPVPNATVSLWRMNDTTVFHSGSTDASGTWDTGHPYGETPTPMGTSAEPHYTSPNGLMGNGPWVYVTVDVGSYHDAALLGADGHRSHGSYTLLGAYHVDPTAYTWTFKTNYASSAPTLTAPVTASVNGRAVSISAGAGGTYRLYRAMPPDYQRTRIGGDLTGGSGVTFTDDLGAKDGVVNAFDLDWAHADPGRAIYEITSVSGSTESLPVQFPVQVVTGMIGVTDLGGGKLLVGNKPGNNTSTFISQFSGTTPEREYIYHFRFGHTAMKAVPSATKPERTYVSVWNTDLGGDPYVDHLLDVYELFGGQYAAQGPQGLSYVPFVDDSADTITTSTLTKSGVDFAALGVNVGDHLASQGVDFSVTAVSTTQLTVTPASLDPANGDHHFQIFMNAGRVGTNFAQRQVQSVAGLATINDATTGKEHLLVADPVGRRVHIWSDKMSYVTSYSASGFAPTGLARHPLQSGVAFVLDRGSTTRLLQLRLANGVVSVTATQNLPASLPAAAAQEIGLAATASGTDVLLAAVDSSNNRVVEYKLTSAGALSQLAQYTSALPPFAGSASLSSPYDVAYSVTGNTRNLYASDGSGSRVVVVASTATGGTGGSGGSSGAGGSSGSTGRGGTGGSGGVAGSGGTGGSGGAAGRGGSSGTGGSAGTGGTAGMSGLKLQYRAGDTNPTDNQAKPVLAIVNGSGAAVTLSELKLRYWYTNEGGIAQTSYCDYAQVNCANVTRAFASVSPARTGADTYLEVGFTSGAGSLAAGASSGEIQLRMNKNDWSNYNESNDYSFDASKTSFADWSKVTLYRNGTLVWGTEP